MSKFITLTQEQLDEFARSVGAVVATKVGPYDAVPKPREIRP